MLDLIFVFNRVFRLNSAHLNVSQNLGDSWVPDCLAWSWVRLGLVGKFEDWCLMYLDMYWICLVLWILTCSCLSRSVLSSLATLLCRESKKGKMSQQSKTHEAILSIGNLARRYWVPAVRPFFCEPRRGAAWSLFYAPYGRRPQQHGAWQLVWLVLKACQNDHSVGLCLRWSVLFWRYLRRGQAETECFSYVWCLSTSHSWI